MARKAALYLRSSKDRHDVSVDSQSRELTKFATESGDRPLVLQQLGRQHLDGHDAVHLGVDGLVDRAHAAGTELLQELVLAQLLGGRCRCAGFGGGRGSLVG